MTLNEYQQEALKTCMPSCNNMAYMLTNLVAEVGELAGKVAKQIRKENAIYRENMLTPMFLFDEDNREAFQEMVAEMAYEAGDILWQLSGVIHRLGYTLDDVARMNLEKLASRAERGKIDGDGDHR